MTPFIKTKIKKVDQTNIDKYKVAANNTENHTLSKLIFLGIIIPGLGVLHRVRATRREIGDSK